MIFVGHDWAEDHHDIAMIDPDGNQLAVTRIPEGAQGLSRFMELVAGQGVAMNEVVMGTETDRGLFVGAVIAAGATVYAVNPKVAERYRDRIRPSGAKHDSLDALVLAELVRADRHLHRQVAADSAEVEALKVLARGHKELIWRRQQFVNQLRSALRDYYPAVLDAFGSDLAHPDALAVLGAAPTPDAGRRLTQKRLAAILRRGGRQRGAEQRADDIHRSLQAEQLHSPQILATAYASITVGMVPVIAVLNQQIDRTEAEISAAFNQHRDAVIYSSLPGLGPILAGRALAEFGDDPDRYDSARARRNYAGTAPVTRQSGKTTTVTRRYARNQRLTDTCVRWAFCSLQHSPGARAYYDQLRARNKGHYAALHQLANRWVGILHGCLANGQTYDETIAWPTNLLTSS
jgi:transposase